MDKTDSHGSIKCFSDQKGSKLEHKRTQIVRKPLLRFAALDKGPTETLLCPPSFTLLREGLLKRRVLQGLWTLMISSAMWGGLSGCAPTDENIYNFNERLEKNIPIVYDKPGEMAENCRSAWSEARIDKEWMENLVFFKSIAHTTAGANNCYQVGSEVTLVNKDRKTNFAPYEGPVRARILKVVLLKPKERGDKLDEIFNSLKEKLYSNESRSEARNYILNETLNLFKSEIQFSQKNESKGGVISQTYFQYVRDSASPAVSKSATNNVVARIKGNTFEQTQSEGDTLKASCGTRVFEDYRTSKEVWDLIVSGKTNTAWDVHTGLLCAKQGSVINVVSRKKDANGNYESFGKIKIGQMRRMKIEALRSDFLKLNSYTVSEAMDEIESLYKKETQNHPDARLFLFDFEVVK
tara:strand:- start:835 stop:2061 length:1227 start_codon:yes stop_codon:yes gene_type:complete